jgi:F-type H+-transporting ATPase subunit gamma
MTSLFLDGEFDEVYVSYTKVMSASSQKPNIFKLLPISIEKEKKEESMKEASADYQFEPDMKRIFSYLLPLYIKVKIFTCFLESSFRCSSIEG